MPPEVPYYRSFAAPPVKFSDPSSPEAYTILPIGRKYIRGKKTMKIPGRRVIPLLVFILSTISILRLLRLANNSSSAPPLPAFPPTLQHTCNSASPECTNIPSHVPGSQTTKLTTPANSTTLMKKEFKLLSDLIRSKAPCNLLIFGLEPQYLKLSSINSEGITVLLEDNPDRIRATRAKSNNTRIYQVDYHLPAKKAFKLLKHARKSPACAPSSGRLQNSTCKLALKNLPQEVYKQKWDVVVVDGPSGHSPEAPGRMSTIYTASIIARAGNTTDVVVHDVDRTIEKWFSWEFLCDENLISSKGKLWNFRVTGKSNSTKFCTD